MGGGSTMTAMMAQQNLHVQRKCVSSYLFLGCNNSGRGIAFHVLLGPMVGQWGKQDVGLNGPLLWFSRVVLILLGPIHVFKDDTLKNKFKSCFPLLILLALVNWILNSCLYFDSSPNFFLLRRLLFTISLSVASENETYFTCATGFLPSCSHLPSPIICLVPWVLFQASVSQLSTIYPKSEAIRISHWHCFPFVACGVSQQHCALPQPDTAERKKGSQPKKGLKSSCCLWLATHCSAVINSAEACCNKGRSIDNSRKRKGLLETIRDLATKRLNPRPLKSLVFCGVERNLMNMKLKSLLHYVKLS